MIRSKYYSIMTDLTNPRTIEVPQSCVGIAVCETYGDEVIEHRPSHTQHWTPKTTDLDVNTQMLFLFKSKLLKDALKDVEGVYENEWTREPHITARLVGVLIEIGLIPKFISIDIEQDMKLVNAMLDKYA